MRSKLLGVAIALAFVAGLGLTSAVAQVRVGETVDYNFRSDDGSFHRTAAGTHKLTHEIRHENATFIKPHFSSLQLAAGSELFVFDEQGRVAAHYQAGDRLPAGKDWTPAVDGSYARIELHSADRSIDSFALDSYGYGTKTLDPTSICGSNDMEETRCYSGVYEDRDHSVGRMLYEKSGSWYVCTGFLVSDDNHFLTNEHCISSQSVCDTLEVRFNYERETCDSSSSIADYDAYGCDAFLTDSYGYDFGLLTLDGDPEATYGHLELNPRALADNEDLYIIEHPGGNPKKIAFGYVSDPSTDGRANESDFAHRVDTEGGSSGSPVFDANDTVVGLHHFGGCTSTGGSNQAVKMEKVYPLIEDYLGSATRTVSAQ